MCSGRYHCGFASCIAWPGDDGTGDGTGFSLTAHCNECHPGLARASARFLGGRPANDKGERYFGVHAPGCTERNRLCTAGMVECPDADMLASSVQKRRLVRWECEQYEEEEYTDMPLL